MSRPPQHRRAGYSKAKLHDDFYAVIDGGRLTPLEDKSQVVEAMTEGPFERFTARGSFAFFSVPAEATSEAMESDSMPWSRVRYVSAALGL